MKKQTRKTTRFTQYYCLYYYFNSVYNAALTANNKKELAEMRERIISNCRMDDMVEAVRFGNIYKIVETDEGGEQDVKLTDEITNRVWHVTPQCK